MVTTPSGLTIEQAEGLSQQQAQQMRLPAENDIFQLPVGEGANQLYIRKGDEILTVRKDLLPGVPGARDWQGKTIGSWISSGTKRMLANLGMEIPTLNRADFDRFASGLKVKDISESEFMSLASGIMATGGVGKQKAALPEITPLGDILGTQISPEKPITPESSLAGIRSVFGQQWQPAPAFTPELQSSGIYGAVRVGGSPNVFTLGPGGGLETPESFEQKFGTLEQEGIVGEITRDQAIALGIKEASIDKPPVSEITSDTIKERQQTNIQNNIKRTENNVSLDTNVVQSGLQKYVDQQTAAKSEEQLRLEKEREDLTGQIRDILGELGEEGAMQLEEEEKRGIDELQQALNDANSDLEIKMAEIQGLDAKYQQEFQTIEGKPITLSSIQGQQAQLYRNYQAQKNVLLSEASLLQAKSLAAQNKLSSAQSAADRAVDLKYNDLKTQLSALSTQLDIVDVDWTREEQIRVDALNRYYSNLDSLIEEQKNMEKTQYNAILDLISKYPDAGIDFSDTLAEAQAKLPSSRIYQDKVRLPVSGGGGSRVSVEEPLSINQIEQFRRSYGWTPPAGFTMEQLTQFMNDNPNLTPEQLEKAARQVASGVSAEDIVSSTENRFLTEEYFRQNLSEKQLKTISDNLGTSKWYTPKSMDINRMFAELMTIIDNARSQGHSDEEIYNFIAEQYGS